MVKGKLSHNYTLEIFSPESIFLLNDETGHINNLIGKYIMEISKMKHLQLYMNTFEQQYRKFDLKKHRQQLSTTFQNTIEEVFETLETAYI